MSLIRPLITERSLAETAKNRYTFVVQKQATKTEIKKTVEKLFGVKVIKVQTVNMPGKTYRTGKRWLKKQRPDGKKTIVTIQAGKTIDLFETTKRPE